MPSPVSFRPIRWSVNALARSRSSRRTRNVPPVVILFTVKWPGDSSGGGRAGRGRGGVAGAGPGRGGRGGVARGRRVLVEPLVGPHDVVLTPERVKGALLRGPGAADRSHRLTFERAGHALMGAILLRPARVDPLILNPEPDPPHIEERQTVDRLGGKRHPICRSGSRAAGHPRERPA